MTSLNKLGTYRRYFDTHLVYQTPWTEEEARESGATYITHSEYRRSPSMLSLRMESIKLSSSLDMPYHYIMFIDDDLLYQGGAEAFFQKVLEALALAPSVISLFGSRYDSVPQYNRDNCIMTTNRGLIIAYDLLKNARFPDMTGPCEDAILGYHALAQDYRHVIIGNAPIKRREVKHIAPDAISSIHNLNAYHNNARLYVRTRYNDPDWEVLTGNFPKGVRH